MKIQKYAAMVKTQIQSAKPLDLELVKVLISLNYFAD